MKTWVKVLLGIVGAIVLLIAAALYFTSGVTEAGDDFFAAVGSGDMDQAYALLSDDFRAGTSERALLAYLTASGLDGVTDTSWNERSVSGRGGKLAGTITIAEGETIPVEIDLVKEQGLWKIHAIRLTATAAGVSSGPEGLPDEKQQVALIEETMAVFADAVAAQDMTGFHGHISRLWANQFDVAKLDDAYGAFYKIGSNLQVIKSLAPAFDAPATLSDEGIMEIEGHYPTSPSRCHFDAKYIYEGTGWKLVGLSVDIK